MNFNNATLLSYNRTSEFFSDTMRYRVNKEVTIQGLLLELANDNGAKQILDDLETFKSDFVSNWQDVILNGVSFGSGIVNNISFAEGNDVRTKEYTVSISIPETGDTNTNGPYANLNFSNFKYIQDFSESSSFTKDVGRDNYTQNINLTIVPPTTIDAINAAKTIAQNFFDYNNLSNTIGSFTSYGGTKKYFTENYDPVNGIFTFSRNFELFKNSDGTFSLSRTHSINFDNEGVLSVTEAADYIGQTNTEFETANAQAKIDIQNAFSRCSNLVSSYQLGGDEALKSQPIEKSWAANPFGGTLNYSISFSNALRIDMGSFDAFHDFTIETSESQGGTQTVAQNGSIIGFGELLSNKNKYTNALSYLNNLTFNLSTYAPNLKFLSSSETHSEIEGRVTYSMNYTNDGSILENQSIRKIVTKISRQYTRNLFSSFNIPNFKEIVQIRNNTLPNEYIYNITVNGKGGIGLRNFLTAARNQISPPPPIRSYLNDINYSFDPSQRELVLNVTYINFSP
jgi:hypothetical protein